MRRIGYFQLIAAIKIYFKSSDSDKFITLKPFGVDVMVFVFFRYSIKHFNNSERSQFGQISLQTIQTNRKKSMKETMTKTLCP